MFLSSNVSHFLLLLLGSLLLLSFISMGNAYKCFEGFSFEADVIMYGIMRTKMVHLQKVGTECGRMECVKFECTVPGDNVNRLVKQNKKDEDEDDERNGRHKKEMDIQVSSARVPVTVFGCAEFCPKGVFRDPDIGTECHTTSCCQGDYCNGATGPNNFGIFATILVATMTSVIYIRHNVL